MTTTKRTLRRLKPRTQGRERVAMSSDPTSQERIASHLAGRLEDFSMLSTAQEEPSELNPDELNELAGTQDKCQLTDDDIREMASDRQAEYPLGVTVKRLVRVDLSTGGPADWFECILDDDGEIEAIRYHFADWFDHAEVSLDGDDFDRAARFLSWFCEGAE